MTKFCIISLIDLLQIKKSNSATSVIRYRPVVKESKYYNLAAEEFPNQPEGNVMHLQLILPLRGL